MSITTIANAKRADEILESVLDADPDVRRQLVEKLCRGNDELSRLVERLLAHAGDDASDVTLLAASAWGAELGRVFPPSPLSAGDFVGSYKLVRRLGIGGSAEVFLAERRGNEGPERVAIKLLLSEVANEVSLARFEQEYRILAQLTHPAIGRTLEAGRKGAAPFFVMEFIDGETIDRWCDRRRLDVRERLALFLQVVEAVAHAHQCSILHRDIKPSNVMVDQEGRPRLVDFGIAKVLDVTRELQLTEPGATPATVGYASPEQLRGEQVGVATDIYQLGMLLYSLLVGALPATPRGLAREELAVLAESQPSPSVRLRRSKFDDSLISSIARNRRTDAERLLRLVEGGLDAIVTKAIAPLPKNRYPSATALAESVRTFLARRPSEAAATCKSSAIVWKSVLRATLPGWPSRWRGSRPA